MMEQVSNSFKDFLVAKAVLNRTAITGTFELTPLCNLDCKMCYISEKKQEVKHCGGLLPESFWIEKAKDAVDQGMLFLLLTGGEPFLYPNFLELYKKLSDMGLFISINTNGTLLDKDSIAFLEKYPPRKLNVSIYGASSDTYRKLCGNGDAYNALRTNLALLKKTNLPVRLRSVLQDENIDDYEKMANFVDTLDMPLSYVYYAFPPVRRDKNSFGINHRFTPEKAGKVKARYEKDRRTSSEYKEYLIDIQHSLENYIEYSAYGKTDVNCQGCKAGFWLNWKGELSLCGMLDTPMVDLKKYDFKYAWNTIRNQLDEIVLPYECSICPKRKYCNTCAASVYAETGGFNQTPEYLCKMTDSFLKIMKEEYERLIENETNI